MLRAQQCRLLDPKTQESYYHKITARYMQFCAEHSKDLNEAFASLDLNENTSASTDATRNPPVRSTSPLNKGLCAGSNGRPSFSADHSIAKAADELSTILVSLRKLREGLLATSKTAPSPLFSQRVHVFNVRLAILAHHPPSYHPSLRYLLFVLQSRLYPLPVSELREMITYLILDMALREADLHGAYALRVRARKMCNYQSYEVDQILGAVVHDNWALFWKMWNTVDGYMRALMFWHLTALRSTSLKAIGKSYHKASIQYILRSVCGNEMSWDQLTEKEGIGWIKDGDVAIIRKPKPRV